MKIKKLFKPKNIIFILMGLTVILLVGFVFNYINKQNIQYQQLSEQQPVEVQVEETGDAGEKLATESQVQAQEETLKSEGQTRTPDTEFREDTLMIF